MNLPLLGSHQAIDFINTYSDCNGKKIEFIPDGVSFVQWLRLVDLITKTQHSDIAERFSIKQLNLVAQQARTERAWARQWLSQLCKGSKTHYGANVVHLNQLIDRCHFKFSLTGRPVLRGPTCAVERVPCIDRPDALLGLVAEPLAHLVACEELQLIKICEAQHCNHWFLDKTRSHKKRFCSPTSCGNRNKVAAYRERSQTTATSRVRATKTLAK